MVFFSFLYKTFNKIIIFKKLKIIYFTYNNIWLYSKYSTTYNTLIKRNTVIHDRF